MPHRTEGVKLHHSALIQFLAILLTLVLVTPGPMPPLWSAPPPSFGERLNSRAESLYEPDRAEVYASEDAAQPEKVEAASGADASQPRTDISCYPDHQDLAQISHIVKGSANTQAEKWGDITVAQPKIWEFERVSSLLDGLLRDVEGVSIADLTQLDPNAQNAAALKFIQSALEVGVQYDQAAALNASNLIQNYQAVNSSQIQQLSEYNTYTQTLTAERDRLAGEMAAATSEVNILQPLSDSGTITPAQVTQLAAAKSRQGNLQSSLAAINSLFSGAGPAPTLTAPPTVVGTSVQAPASGSSMSSSLSGFADVLKSLPQGVTNNLTTALQSPSYPATKRLDNFVTLLYERLAREVSVLQDDLTRDPDNVPFLLQFDVGLYPSKKANDHVARVEFDVACPGCKVYSIYPGQSAYNLANYSGASKRYSFWGNVLTLIGLGVSGSYRRQQDTLQGSLVQSVYTAGFQDGMLDEKNDGSQFHAIPDSSAAEETFGWYYGQAPFEKLVSPGIRTTFAIITVPRKLIEGTADYLGNSNACLGFHINGGWANRNDPLAQDSYLPILGQVSKLSYLAYVPKRRPLASPPTESVADSNSGQPSKPYDASVVRKMASVRLPGNVEDLPLVVRREKQKLHVISLEYNSVYEEPTPTTSSLSAASPASASVVASVSTAKSSPPFDPLPCPIGECAAMLLKLDRPIDPNLVITVRGKPLQRVRDWQGRATSILPAAQSLSDQPAQGASASTTPAGASPGAPVARQTAPGRSLLESDQFVPNSWFALNSHELLLNVSREVASDDEFPVIQISDPSDTVIIPHEIQQSTTEVIVNGFHMYPQSRERLKRQIAVNFGDESVDDRNTADKESDVPTNPGPYPFSTYLPLFMPDPSAQHIYARVGETSEDLLIGFVPDRFPTETGSNIQRPEWKEGQDQVILEDRDLDFAWSLSCTVQGDELACRLPRSSMSDAYQALADVCFRTGCPSIKTGQRSFLQVVTEMQKVVNDGADKQDDKGKPETENKAKGKIKENNDAKTGTPPTDQVKRTKSASIDYVNAGNVYVPSLEVWVSQADPEGQYTFYSPQPAPINFFPLSKSYWPTPKDDSNARFESWHFVKADPNGATVEGCNYYPKLGDVSGVKSVTVLGTFSPTDVPIRLHEGPVPNGGIRDLALAPSDMLTGCQQFDVTTSGLSHDQIVLLLHLPSGSQPTIVLDTSRLRPYFGRPKVQHQIGAIRAPDGATQYRITNWTIDIPAHRLAMGDKLDIPEGLQTGFDWTWRQGQTILNDKDPLLWNWASDNDSISLHLEVTREALRSLPREIGLIRTNSDGSKHTVTLATVPNILELALPSQLELDAISPTQFVLRGQNATAIDAVAVQNGNTTQEINTATGVDFALFTVTVQSSTNSAPPTTASGTDASGQTTIVTTNNNSATVKMTTSNKNAATTPKPSKPASEPSPSAVSALKPGIYTVLPLMIVCEQQGSAEAAPLASADKKKVGAITCTPVALPRHNDEAALPIESVSKETATKSGAKPVSPKPQPKQPMSPIYVPIDVTADKSKPLSITVADPNKSPTAPAAATPTPNCVSPCLLLPCMAACSLAPAAAPPPKTP